MSQAQMIDPATVYAEGRRVSEENARLRSLLGKAADHIDALGDPMSAVMIREAIKREPQPLPGARAMGEG